MKRAKIICVRCDSHTDTGIVDRCTAQFSNGETETYDGEIPPASVAMFCRMAKFGYKNIDGTSMTDWYTMKPMSREELNV
jgi:hypothetical protein